MAYYLSKPIAIVDYDPRWPSLYEHEQRRLLEILGPIVIRIEHIGSTSIPELAAKPIIDISVAVRDRADITPYVPALRDLGYEEIPIMPVLQRRMFSKGPYNEGTHHVHVTDYGSDIWAKPIMFRDYLRAHPDVARAYADVKRAAAAQHKHDLDGYHDEKAPFVDRVMEQARAWRASRTEDTLPVLLTGSLGEPFRPA